MKNKRVLENKSVCEEFSNALLQYAPVYSEAIIKDICPTQGWIGHVSTGLSSYESTLNSVRQLVEGDTYIPTYFPQDNIEMFNRINEMFPNLNEFWK